MTRTPPWKSDSLAIAFSRLTQRWLSLFTACLLAFTAPLSRAQEPNPAAPAEAAREKIAEYIRLSVRLKSIFEEKNYAEAVEVCQKMSELMPRAAEPQYNLACSYARLGRSGEALTALAKSVELGFDDAAHIQKDDDLESLHADAKFAELVTKAKTIGEGRIEKGEEIAGVKTVEGAPEGGLRFRVRMSPEATKEKPQRLMIWMHPSGGSMDSTVEKLAPRFSQHGYALVVFTKKNYAGWSAADISRLPKTLDALAAIDGLSDERPVLLGYSAGGQMALVLWHACGAGLGGIILGAAYPVVPGGDGQFTRMELPENPLARRVPLFVAIGGKDEGSEMWKKMESTFKEGGTSMSMNVVEGKGHEWLFGENELQALDLWLEEIARHGDQPGPKSWRPKLGP